MCNGGCQVIIKQLDELAVNVTLLGADGVNGSPENNVSDNINVRFNEQLFSLNLKRVATKNSV